MTTIREYLEAIEANQEERLVHVRNRAEARHIQYTLNQARAALDAVDGIAEEPTEEVEEGLPVGSLSKTVGSCMLLVIVAMSILVIAILASVVPLLSGV